MVLLFLGTGVEKIKILHLFRPKLLNALSLGAADAGLTANEDFVPKLFLP
jgi:hypothetical protein